MFATARDLKTLKQLMNTELKKKMKVWCDINKLSINFSKTNFMIIKYSKKKNQEVNIKIENVNGTCHFLQRKDRIKYLGVLIDETVCLYQNLSQ